jgi:hypothetical protein
LHRGKPVFDQLEQLFARLFKRGEYPPETEDYREFIRRGGAIVSADVSEMQVDLARDLMRRTGAADIEERAKAWRSGSGEADISEHALHRGSSTTRESSSRDEPSTAQQADTMTRGGQIAGTARSADTTEHFSTARDASPLAAAPRTPTSDESAGGRTAMQGSGFSSAAPKIVGGMQQVTTRTEGLGSTASVENRQQLSEAPDVGLTRTPEERDAGLKSRTAYSPDVSTSGAKAERTAGTGRVGDPVMGNRLDSAPDDDELRKDYDAHFAHTGTSYDEYRRAYTHGATLRQDERYRGHDWQQVEPGARENWESRYPESGWERFKAAVRHGWERVTGG